MDDTKRFFASEARKLTDNSDFLLRNCYKWIREAAVRNCNQLVLDSYEYDTNVVSFVISELKSSGYNIREDMENNCFYITW